MKSLLFTVSLTICLFVFCVCSFMGVRLWPSVIRASVAFVLTYISGLILALVVFVDYLSQNERPARNKKQTIPPQNEINSEQAQEQA